MSTMLRNWTPRRQTETVVVIISEAHHIANVIRVKRREIQTLHCSKLFTFLNAYSAQVFF
jgi:hypothetical protein